MPEVFGVSSDCGKLYAGDKPQGSIRPENQQQTIPFTAGLRLIPHVKSSDSSFGV